MTQVVIIGERGRLGRPDWRRLPGAVVASGFGGVFLVADLFTYGGGPTWLSAAIAFLVAPYVLPWSMFRSRSAALALIAWLAVPLAVLTGKQLVTGAPTPLDGFSALLWMPMAVHGVLWLAVWAAWRHARPFVLRNPEKAA